LTVLPALFKIGVISMFWHYTVVWIGPDRDITVLLFPCWCWV